MNSPSSTTPTSDSHPPPQWERQKTEDGSDTLYHPIYQQTYHSRHGALTESKHVFIHNSNLPHRLKKGAVSILEIGIGTGLNLVLSATLAQRARKPLKYTGIEQHPPTSDILTSLNYADLEDVDDGLWAICQNVFQQRITHCEPSPYLQLQCLWKPFETVRLPPSHFDIVYHDGFSPDVNAELWTKTALQHIANAIRPGGTLVTYTVQGRLRRALAQCGLSIERLPGPPGGKRQVLRCTKPQDTPR